MEKDREIIGSVTIDLTYYKGTDIYSDGDAEEEELLQIAKEYPEEELNRVISEKKSWPVLYHFSHIRENIIGALPFTGEEDVLEVGAGCGAVTGELARKAAHVTCVDLSLRRSRINAYRHRDLDNITLMVGNFQDIERGMTKKFDVITLIGVLEYAKSYIGGEDPYTEFLSICKAHLKEGGRVIIAIENRLGLKYWAGAREDHTGQLFEGLENYDEKTGVRTFERAGLEKLFQKASFSDARFYYPYPDYKLPLSIWSDSYLPGKGELNTNTWNFDRSRLMLFDESRAFDSLVEDQLFPVFSNSYLVILENNGGRKTAGEKLERVEYARFSNDREPHFAIRTEICRGKNGKRIVRKCPDSPAAEAHIAGMEKSFKELVKVFEGTPLKVNRAKLDGKNLVLEYLKDTRSLEDICIDEWQSGNREAVFEKLAAVTDVINAAAGEPFEVTKAFTELFGISSYPFEDRTLSFTDVDMVPSNILVDSAGTMTLTDYEWTADFPVPVRFLCYRVMHYFHAAAVQDMGEEDFLRLAGFADDEIRLFEGMEGAWQQYVSAGHVPLREMYGDYNQGLVPLDSLIGGTEFGGTRREGWYESGIFYCDDGIFKASQCRQQTIHIDADGHFEVTISPAALGHPKYLRWDPVENRLCRVRIEKIESTGQLMLRPLSGFQNGEWTDFWTMDPAYQLHGPVDKIDEFTISGTIIFQEPREVLPGMFEAGKALEECRRENALLHAQLDAIRSTKGWRGIEKLRQARNFTTARMAGIHLIKGKEPVDETYMGWFEAHRATEQTLAQQRMTVMPLEPKISILVPVWNTPEEYLRAMIDSVRAQSYANWELCIADSSVGGETAGPNGRNNVVENILRSYMQEDPRIKVTFMEKNLGISGNTNEAAGLAGGELIALLDHDDILAPDALFEVVQALNLEPEADVIYTDEDKIDMEGQIHFDPNLKPDFSPYLLRSHNYITHFLVIRKDLFDRIGGFRSEYDGAQDYDLVLRATEKAEKVVHVPRVLYYWRNHPDSTAQNPKSKMYAYEAGRKAIAGQLKRQGREGQVEITELWGLNHVRYGTPGDPLVSVIIPNMDHADDLERCVTSIMEKSTYRNLEILIIENNSKEKKTLECYRRLKDRYPAVRVLRWDKPFNYSAINSCGVKAAKGDYLLLLNNDTELIEPDSIGEMLGICMQPDAGCVGAKLLYADDTVQHAGIILGPGGFAGHVFHGLKKDDVGFKMRARITGNWSAVTAACLMIRKDVYYEAGGFDENLAVALNDVDLCLKVGEKGYQNVMTPFALWHHYESKSRGYEDTPEKKARFEKEVALFRSRWGETVDAGDPYYNPNFAKDKAPFTL